MLPKRFPCSLGCIPCFKMPRKTPGVLRLTSENDVTKAPLGGGGEGEGGPSCEIFDCGDADTDGVSLSSNISRSWEGVSWRSSLPCLLGGKRGVVAALSRSTTSSGRPRGRWPSIDGPSLHLPVVEVVP